MTKHCSVCDVPSTSKSNGSKYCHDCSKKVRKSKYAGYSAKYEAKQRYHAIQKHKNDSTYGRNKVVLLNHQWWAVIYDGHRNYIVIKKIKKEGGDDIWGVIRNAIKRGRRTYHTSLESALRTIYGRIRLNCPIDRSHGFAKGIFSLRNMIIDTDFNGHGHKFDCMLLDYVDREYGYGSDVFSLKNAIIDTKKELFEAISKPYDKSLGRIDIDGCRLKNEGELK